ncbi:hypothetical protein Dimus_031643 [Dionaea muscipula]
MPGPSWASMTLKQLSLTSAPVDGHADAISPTSGGGEVGDEGCKVPRLPRWSRKEILVLIQGKKVVENRVQRGRRSGIAFGSGQVEPKWASVSSYCRRHGVNRGPVQCRKRWSNLAGDYKKIKEWEAQIREDSESFWVMRNDLRRERKLPGFFDKEVYDLLNEASSVSETRLGLALALALAPATASASGEDDEKDNGDGVTMDEADVVAEAVFDSGRSAAADDGLFSDFEQSGQDEMGRSLDLEKEVPITATFPAPMPISEKQYQPFLAGGLTGQGGQGNEKQPLLDTEIGSTSRDGRKRKRITAEGDVETASLQDHLIRILERNGRILEAQLEAQNTNLKLDRQERKDRANSLVAVLNKLADALGQIADKL